MVVLGGVDNAKPWCIQNLLSRPSSIITRVKALKRLLSRIFSMLKSNEISYALNHSLISFSTPLSLIASFFPGLLGQIIIIQEWRLESILPQKFETQPHPKYIKKREREEEKTESIWWWIMMGYWQFIIYIESWTTIILCTSHPPPSSTSFVGVWKLKVPEFDGLHILPHCSIRMLDCAAWSYTRLNSETWVRFKKYYSFWPSTVQRPLSIYSIIMCNVIQEGV